MYVLTGTTAGEFSQTKVIAASPDQFKLADFRDEAIKQRDALTDLEKETHDIYKEYHIDYVPTI